MTSPKDAYLDDVERLADALIDALCATVKRRNAVRREDRKARSEGRLLYAAPGAMK